LMLQARRLRSVPLPGIDTVNEIVSRGFIPASHSFECAMLRL
jgi:hypothetical protein